MSHIIGHKQIFLDIGVVILGMKNNTNMKTNIEKCIHTIKCTKCIKCMDNIHPTLIWTFFLLFVAEILPGPL